MAGIALEVFALLTGSALGIIGLLFPHGDASTSYLAQGHSLVRVGIGLNSSTSEGLGGTVPSIRVYNEEVIPIGRASGSNLTNIGAGKYITIPVIQNMTYQQPTYLEVAGGPDAVCVAYLAQTWSDGTQVGWLGDIGKFCGAKWYYSNLYVGTSNGSMYKPYCTWIGGHRNQNALFEYSGLRIHTPDFGPVDSSNHFNVPENPTALCNYPKLEWYRQPIFQSAAPSFRPFTFSHMLTVLNVFSLIGSTLGAPIKKLPSWNWDERNQVSFRPSIVGSHDVRHSSRYLCASLTSWGPDFVSFEEGIFCDMSLKKTWPLCGGKVAKNCYDWQIHAILDGRRRKREIRYRNAIEWK
ncbi:uncharacterized protein BDR25DRAFT_347010 [Lindgomyces ingoldianus]|uniref:Uncharacterized protein n=1 Tax=Lindgomyces ingoldianus TaxID=673940 RepID=A0ACB6QCC9_9PLEO|nr:uncharacterized protein BDR25DRAFT_347010 [Lindgomyces ingoldianus]KAF2463777.1 hypothetical protein BDR25DRAFT_347010 [Lindgomyces ingoldianus]